jgi:uncharacterized protein|tara:strand:- start:341 stop:604 length:264 start_codon:yes stop_codon:yes gene_type:complete
MIEFDRQKDEANQLKHGVSLARAEDFEIDATIIDPFPSERRFRAFGRIDGQYYCLIFTLRAGRVRAISLRRAHQKEYDLYVPPKPRP